MRFWVRRHPLPRRLVMLMAVRDEADILAHNLEFHFARGVDFVRVADNGSTDGTQEILERFRAEGRLAWEQEPDPGYNQAAWMTRLARKARDEDAADWLVCCDADEFWQPATGDLKDFIATQRAPVLRCARRNEILVVDPGAGAGPVFPQVRFAPVLRARRWRQRCADRSARELSDPAVPGIVFHEEGPKVLVRAGCAEAVTQGNHDVGGRHWRAQPGARSLTVHHFPIRSARQFEAKVRAGGAAYARTALPPAVGWHWRHWHACLAAGRLDEAFRRETTVEPVTARPAPGVELGKARAAADALGLARGPA